MRPRQQKLLGSLVLFIIRNTEVLLNPGSQFHLSCSLSIWFGQFLYRSVVDLGEGPRGPAPSPLF